MANFHVFQVFCYNKSILLQKNTFFNLIGLLEWKHISILNFMILGWAFIEIWKMGGLRRSMCNNFLFSLYKIIKQVGTINNYWFNNGRPIIMNFHPKLTELWLILVYFTFLTIIIQFHLYKILFLIEMVYQNVYIFTWKISWF